MASWVRYRHYGWGEYGERFHHAGISIDGRHVFLAEFDDVQYWAIDLDSNKTVWSDDGTDGEGKYPPLSEWHKDGFIEIEVDSFNGSFRLFGIEQNFPIVETENFSISKIETSSSTITLQDKNTGQIQVLEFEANSGDWAFASFSSDNNILAVLEPYELTVFKNEKTQ